MLGLAFFGVVGCGKSNASTAYPQAPRTVIAEPSAYDGVYVERGYRYHEVPAAHPEALGYEELSNGERVVVVEYVHTYPDAVETFPNVTWSGRTYYNVHGDFVYWSDDWGWCYYLGPPAPLVVYWNGYYPWAPYAWGVGYYGPGWYWGGVGMYGYHAYGLPVAHHHHHHHGYYARDQRPGRDPRPSAGAVIPSTGAPAAGGPSGGVSPGAPTRPPRRTKTAARRNPPGSGQGSKARRQPPKRLATGPVGSRRNPSSTPVRTNGYTTAGGQRLTVIDPRGTQRSPAVRRAPKTIGTVPPPAFDARPARANPRPTTAPNSFANPGRRQPARANPAPTASRANPGRAKPARTNRTPSWGPSYANKPAKRAQPSRSNGPSRSNPSSRGRNPSRSVFGGSRSAPKRSAPSRSAPSRSAPSRSAPKRSAPSRSAPKRSAPSRSAPKRSAPSRRAPSRSNGKKKR